MTFQEPTSTTDDAGQKTITYTDAFSMRCDALVLSSRKAEQYDQVQTGSDVVQLDAVQHENPSRLALSGTVPSGTFGRARQRRARILEVTAERFGE